MNWQKPETKMPEPDELVLFWVAGYPRVARWSGTHWQFADWETERNPDWWAPIDEPPAEMPR
jgi:hypothetical protein